MQCRNLEKGVVESGRASEEQRLEGWTGCEGKGGISLSVARSQSPGGPTVSRASRRTGRKQEHSVDSPPPPGQLADLAQTMPGQSGAGWGC